MIGLYLTLSWFSAWLLEQEVPNLILSDFNACFNFPLICVAAIAFNNHKMGTNRRREGGS